MEITTVDRERAAQFTDDVVELVYNSGPPTYDYHSSPERRSTA